MENNKKINTNIQVLDKNIEIVKQDFSYLINIKVSDLKVLLSNINSYINKLNNFDYKFFIVFTSIINNTYINENNIYDVLISNDHHLDIGRYKVLYLESVDKILINYDNSILEEQVISDIIYSLSRTIEIFINLNG